MFIDDRHKDMIIHALKAMRFEEEDAVNWGNAQAVVNVGHIDAALSALTQQPPALGVWQPIDLATFSEDGFTVAISGNLLSILWDEDGVSVSNNWTMPPDHAVCQRAKEGMMNLSKETISLAIAVLKGKAVIAESLRDLWRPGSSIYNGYKNEIAEIDAAIEELREAAARLSGAGE